LTRRTIGTKSARIMLVQKKFRAFASSREVKSKCARLKPRGIAREQMKITFAREKQLQPFSSVGERKGGRKTGRRWSKSVPLPYERSLIKERAEPPEPRALKKRRARFKLAEKNMRKKRPRRRLRILALIGGLRPFLILPGHDKRGAGEGKIGKSYTP